MNSDKIGYLFWSIIVILLILGVAIFSKYGSSMINDKTFQMFFGWYITLVILNLFNILMNLIYHYFMKNLQGPRGLKGEAGDKGLPGKDDKCGCKLKTVDGETDGFDIDEADSITTATVSFDNNTIQDIDYKATATAPENTRKKISGVGTVIIGGQSN